MTNHVCLECKIDHPISAFYDSAASKRHWLCKECTKRRSRRDREGRPQHEWRKELRDRYGLLAVSEYRQLYSLQAGKCAICKTPESAIRGGKVKALAVDHDHETGEMRALLCHRCNAGIGQLRDNAGLAMRAAAYLFAFEEARMATAGGMSYEDGGW